MVKKTPGQQVENTLQEVGGHVSLSAFKRRLHEQHLRGFPTRFKPVGLKEMSGTKYYGLMKQKSNAINMMERVKCGEQEKEHMTLIEAESWQCPII